MTTDVSERVALAHGLSGGVVSLERAWQTVLERLASAGVGESLAWLARAADTPNRAGELAAFLRGAAQAEEMVALWRRSCAVDGWSPTDYLAAVLAVVEHARERGVRTDPASVHGYVCCAAEVAARRGDRVLEPVVRDFLARHGFAGI